MATEGEKSPAQDPEVEPPLSSSESKKNFIDTAQDLPLELYFKILPKIPPDEAVEKFEMLAQRGVIYFAAHHIANKTMEHISKEDEKLNKIKRIGALFTGVIVGEIIYQQFKKTHKK